MLRFSVSLLVLDIFFQTYVAAGQERLGATTTSTTAHIKQTGQAGPQTGGLTNTLTSSAVSALETAKGVLASAQATLAPHAQVSTIHASHLDWSDRISDPFIYLFY